MNYIKPFYLKRKTDISGISGTGIVATGSILSSGKAVMEWLSFESTITIFQNISQVEEIHSHDGATEVIMGHPPKKKGKKHASKI